MPPRTRKATTKKAASPPQEQPELSTPSTGDEALDAAIAQAQPADDDLEEMLHEYEQLTSDYKEPTDHKKRREELRDKISAILTEDGSRLYAGRDGRKYYAWATTPETVDLDVDALVELDEQGEIPFDVLDKVAPRQLNRDGLAKAIKSGELNSGQVKKLTTIRKQTARVYTKPDPSDDGDE